MNSDSTHLEFIGASRCDQNCSSILNSILGDLIWQSPKSIMRLIRYAQNDDYHIIIFSELQ